MNVPKYRIRTKNANATVVQTVYNTESLRDAFIEFIDYCVDDNKTVVLEEFSIKDFPHYVHLMEKSLNREQFYVIRKLVKKL